MLKRFPIFYSYVGCVLIIDATAIPLVHTSPKAYFLFYWSSEFLTAVLGYALIIEIYHLSLKRFPGVARLVKLLLVVVFLGILVKSCAGLLANANVTLPYAIGDLERTLRQLQAVMLGCLLIIFAYYRIPASSNLRGIILGYSLFVAVDVVSVTIITHPATGFAALIRSVEPAVYGVSLLIWTASLWNPSARVAFEETPGTESDYLQLARATRMLLIRARAQLLRAVRP